MSKGGGNSDEPYCGEPTWVDDSSSKPLMVHGMCGVQMQAFLFLPGLLQTAGVSSDGSIVELSIKHFCRLLE